MSRDPIDPCLEPAIDAGPKERDLANHGEKHLVSELLGHLSPSSQTREVAEHARPLELVKDPEGF